MASKIATILFKRSSTASSVPSGLQAGEPAINTVDKKLYSSDGTTVFQVAPSMAELAQKEGSITAGTTSQYFRGDKTWRDFATDVRAAVLTGLSTSTSTVVAAADTVLVAIGKLQAQVTLRATIASPTFTGTPAAPTATAGTSTTQVATTAFVQTAVSGSEPTFDTIDGGTF